MAAVRQVFNPMEKDDVIGITNYVDVGLQLHVPLAAAGGGEGKVAAAAASGDATQAGLRLAGAWQVNAVVMLYHTLCPMYFMSSSAYVARPCIVP